MAGGRLVKGIEFGFPLGYSPWNAEMDLNLRLLAVLAKEPVAANITNAEPGSPSQGDIVILDNTHGTQPNDIAVYDNSGWVYITPYTGLKMFVATPGRWYVFNGTLWVVSPEIVSPVMGYFPGVYTASQILIRTEIAQKRVFDSGLAGSRATVEVAPADANASFDILKAAAVVGSIDVTQTTGAIAFTMASATTFDPGDLFTLRAPGTADSAMAGLGCALMSFLDL